jgi:monofunctional biosynthetic peptidoglycan transglycosylase
MEVYLNEIEMGDGIYGIEAAAQAYFHKPASRLTKHEAAAIAVHIPEPAKMVGHQSYPVFKA